MTIELKGIIVFYAGGHKHVEVVVCVDNAAGCERHLFGVDVEPNRGKIITFLAVMYDVLPSEIVWPDHIKVKDDG